MTADTIELRHRGMRVGKNLTLALLLPSDVRRSNDCDSCTALLSARRALREARSLVLALFDTSCCGIACTEGPICEQDEFDQHHPHPYLHPMHPPSTTWRLICGSPRAIQSRQKSSRGITVSSIQLSWQEVAERERGKGAGRHAGFWCDDGACKCASASHSLASGRLGLVWVFPPAAWPSLRWKGNTACAGC